MQEVPVMGFDELHQAMGLNAFWLQRDGTIRHCNQKFAKLLGFTQEELCRKQIFQLSIQMTFFQLRDIWMEIEENNYVEWDDEFLLKDATLKLKIHACLVDAPEGALIYCVAQEVAPLGKIVQLNPVKLTKNSFPHFASMAVEYTNALVFWLDSNFSIKYLNDRAKMVLGFEDGDEVRLRSFFKIDHAFAQQGWETIQKGLDNKRRLEFTGNMVNAMGQTIPVEYYLFRIEPENKENICLIARDATEKIKQENILRNALKDVEELTQKLKIENIYLQEELSNYSAFDNIVSESKAFKKVLRSVAQVAATDSTVLILGETGTGKELIAKALHKLSNRNEQPFLKVNCAALPHDIMESELFGHEKGAFTGAFERRIGRFEAANGGTLFLDEVGEIPMDLQTRLLRVLQEQEFERIGGNQTIKVNVRIVAATNRDLASMVEQGKFRKDLYYRLNVFPIHNLPLRERKEDILPLVRHFIKKYNQQMGKNVRTYVEADIELLKSYDFPGNIRELENIIERAVILSEGEKLDLSNWQMSLNAKPRGVSFEEVQRLYIITALKKTNGKITGKGGAAELLGMPHTIVLSKMEQLGIQIA